MKRGLKKEMQIHKDYWQKDANIDTSISRERLKIYPRPYPLSNKKSISPEGDEKSSCRQNGHLQISNYLDQDFLAEIRKDVLYGLSLAQKSIPSKYFYDINQVCK